jgi:predicted exporter
LELTGVGAFGVELQQTIRAEAKKRSILATSALLLVLLVVYRNLRYLLLATLPIGMGFLVGLAIVTLVFDNVHGITLAFGFTLLGIAIDYPLHLFSHARQNPGNVAIQNIWPTMRLGAASTAIAYLAIALSGSEGLAQLGVFTTSGVITAVWATRAWLPALLTERASPGPLVDGDPKQPGFSILPAVVFLALALFATHHLLEGGLWDDRLSSLSPVPEQRIKTDRMLRSAAGTPDMRYQLVLHASSLESLLRESETVDLLLADAVNDGLLDGWQSVSQILPSQEVQDKRRDAIPDRDRLRNQLTEAVLETPFRADAFQPFEANADTTRSLSNLAPSHFEDTPLAIWLDSHLVRLGDKWVSLVTLNQPKPAELAERLDAWDAKLELVDLQQSSLGLMHDYRTGAIRTISIASLIIIALLLFECKQPGRILWIALTVTAALAVTIAMITSFHTSLTVIHLVALMLVLGLGLDYALFLSRTETATERKATHQAVMACAASTTLAFGILAGSSIPVLKFLGLTVAAGSAANFVLAFSGSLMWRSKVS